MTATNLSTQAKALMEAANALDDAVGAKYGSNSSVSLSATETAIRAWVVLCDLERLESDNECCGRE